MKMRLPPLSVLETWPIPNYVDPTTQKPYLIPIMVILTFAAVCMVILRVYARICRSYSVCIDDWLVAAAIITGIAYTVCISIAVTHFGWDRHIYDIPPGPGNINQVKERAISWAVQNLYFWTADFTKLSMLCFYRRAFTTRTMQKLVILSLVITLLFHLLCILLLCLECRPLNFYWEEYRLPAPSHGWCGNEGAGLVTTGIINVLLDVVILVLPIRTVLTLNILWSQKLQVLSIFAAGILVVICSTLRVYEVWQTTEVTYDITWVGYNAYLLTGVEMFVGIICACVPACRGLLKQWRLSTGQSHEIPGVAKHEFSTTMDSTRASTIPPNAIKKKTRTTVDISYRKMVESPPHNDSGSQHSLGIASSLNAGDPSTSVWGANGSATNITKAWAGKDKRQKRASLMMDEEVEMEKLGLCSRDGGMDGADRMGRKVAFEDQSGSSGGLVDERG